MEKYKTSWDLTLLYKSPKDPQIEKDMVQIENLCTSLEKKYKNKKFIESPAKLFTALEEIETLSNTIAEAKPLLYFWLRTEYNSADTVSKALLQKIETRVTVASNKLIFLDLAIASIPLKDQKKFLSYLPLEKYRRSLEKTFLSAKHLLSEKEEQLVSLLSQPASSMWSQANTTFLGKQTITFDGKKIPASEARELLPSLPKKKRGPLYQKLVEVYKKVSVTAEPELNAIATFKKICDEKRGYATPWAAEMIGHELDEKTVSTLVSLTTKYFSISQRFYALHAKLLGEKKIPYHDRQIEIGKIQKKFTFEESVSLVQKAFDKVGPQYRDIIDTFLRKGQIDVFPRSSKSGGGYCASTSGNPTFILLNHTNNIKSAETIAHEFGHAFHSYYTQKFQPVHYHHYPFATAEVASTFFEQVFDGFVTEVLSEKDHITLLHNRVLRDVVTTFRQIACFNFEAEYHATLKEKGYLPSKEIQSMLSKHMKAYLGPSVVVEEDDGLEFVSWSHLRMFFYTITYTYGFLVSKAMYQKWLIDPSYAKKVEQFLSAGSSMSPKDVFKSIGIDTSDPKFFEAGLKAIDDDITTLEKLAKKAKLI